MAQLENRVKLLEQYAETLERQNFAKNNETTLLYQKVASVQQQNDMLKSYIQAMKEREIVDRQRLQQQMLMVNTIPIASSRNFEVELRSSVNMNDMKIVAEDIRQQLQHKQEQIEKLHEQIYFLKDNNTVLKDELTKTANHVLISEEKLRRQMQENKKLSEQNFASRNSRVEVKGGISFARLQVDKLIKQNSDLTERIQYLQNEKNSYPQKRMVSPLKNRSPNTNKNTSSKSSLMTLSRNKPGASKADRWNIMQQKIRAIRNQNQQLKANLAIQ